MPIYRVCGFKSRLRHHSKPEGGRRVAFFGMRLRIRFLLQGNLQRQMILFFFRSCQNLGKRVRKIHRMSEEGQQELGTRYST